MHPGVHLQAPTSSRDLIHPAQGLQLSPIRSSYPHLPLRLHPYLHASFVVLVNSFLTLSTSIYACLVYTPAATSAARPTHQISPFMDWAGNSRPQSSCQDWTVVSYSLESARYHAWKGSMVCKCGISLRTSANLSLISPYSVYLVDSAAGTIALRLHVPNEIKPPKSYQLQPDYKPIVSTNQSTD